MRVWLHDRMMRPAAGLLAAALGLIGGAGCQKPEPPPVAYSGPTLAAADLGLAGPVDAPSTSFVLLDHEPSQGRFPLGLAVARLERPNPLFVNESPLFVSEHGWEIADVRPEEGTHWLTLFKTVPPVREVKLVDRLNVVSPDVDLKEVLRSVRRLQLELLLIYGPIAAPPDAAGLAGVLLDVETGDYLAYVQAQAGIADYEPPRPDRPRHDLSHLDPNYLVARKFEQQVRTGMLELIARDRRATTTQPSPWKDAIGPTPISPDAVPVYIIPNRRADW